MVVSKKYVLSKRVSTKIDIKLSLIFDDELFQKLIDIFYIEPTQVDELNIIMMDKTTSDND